MNFKLLAYNYSDNRTTVTYIFVHVLSDFRGWVIICWFVHLNSSCVFSQIFKSCLFFLLVATEILSLFCLVSLEQLPHVFSLWVPQQSSLKGIPHLYIYELLAVGLTPIIQWYDLTDNLHSLRVYFVLGRHLTKIYFAVQKLFFYWLIYLYINKSHVWVQKVLSLKIF